MRYIRIYDLLLTVVTFQLLDSEVRCNLHVIGTKILKSLYHIRSGHAQQNLAAAGNIEAFVVRIVQA